MSEIDRDLVMNKLVAASGNLVVLTPPERVWYYNAMCERVGLDPVTQPFKLLLLDGKLVLYCDRSGSTQLVHKHGVSHTIVNREVQTDAAGDCYVVTARAEAGGRHTESLGATPLYKENGEWKQEQGGKRRFHGDGTYKPVLGEARCNAMMKAETKAKRRSTMDLLGLGMLDESETSSIPGAEIVPLDVQLEERDKEREAEARKRATEPPKTEAQMAAEGAALAAAAQKPSQEPAPAPKAPKATPAPRPVAPTPPAPSREAAKAPAPKASPQPAPAAPQPLPPGIENAEEQGQLVNDITARLNKDGISVDWLETVCIGNGWIKEGQRIGFMPTKTLRYLLLDKNWVKVQAKWNARKK